MSEFERIKPILEINKYKNQISYPEIFTSLKKSILIENNLKEYDLINPIKENLNKFDDIKYISSLNIKNNFLTKPTFSFPTQQLPSFYTDLDRYTPTPEDYAYALLTNGADRQKLLDRVVRMIAEMDQRRVI